MEQLKTALYYYLSKFCGVTGFNWAVLPCGFLCCCDKKAGLAVYSLHVTSSSIANLGFSQYSCLRDLRMTVLGGMK